MVNGNDTVHVTSKFQKITLCKSKPHFCLSKQREACGRRKRRCEEGESL